MSRPGPDNANPAIHQAELAPRGRLETEPKMFYLSDEALGAIMMALQKSLMEQSDIVSILKGFKR